VRLEEEGALPLPEVISIGLQLARALEYAAGRGIAHHGIKPGNIMLLAAGPGDDPKIKVTDFGIAQIWPIAPFAAVAKAANAPGRHLQQGTVPGSLQYLSPEQTRGEAADGRSDLFSAGVLLYQMLAGVRPFRADSPVALAACIANDTPPPLAQKRPDVPPALRRVVERCLAKQPEQRYASANDLAEALLRVQGEVEAAERVRSRPRQVPLRVKWAAALALVVTVVMALTAGLVAQRQYAALMAQVGEHGRSMAGLVAAQHAGQVLGEEWNSIDAQVQEVMRTGSVERLIVVDAAGLVRVSSLPALVGQSYQPEGQALPELSAEGTTVRRFSSQGQSLLGFDAPVLFQGKPLGRVLLGLAEAPLTQVARQSVMLLLLLAGVTVLAVAVAVYFLANWFVRPLRTLADAMAEIGKGRLAHRIAEPRNDEFGQLYQSFDAMAQALQRRNAGADPDSTTRKR
jgi:serine/threonine-protein kinase